MAEMNSPDDGRGAPQPQSSSALELARWRARQRLEDQRRAAVRSPVEAALCDVLATLEVVPAFERGASIPISPMPLGSRTLTEAFASALEEASRLANDAAAAMPEWREELAEVVARRLANRGSSRYEHAASLEWPAYAAVCPRLRSTFRLAPSGLVTYAVSPGGGGSATAAAAGGAVGWELSGEGCWRVLPADGRATVIILELCQGLEGRAPTTGAGAGAPVNEHAREPPSTLRVDLRECIRVPETGSEEDEDESGESEDGEGEDGNDDMEEG